MKLYIAGPDVFRPDAAAWAETVRGLCRGKGHEALIPLDGSQTCADDIYRNNLSLIGAADAVLANLNPFRGAEPDAGTCVEIGYALAIGKPVIGYVDTLVPMRDRLQATGPGADGRYRDEQGWIVEDFGLSLNLMLSVPLPLKQGGIEVALDALQEMKSQST
ncbi:MAG: nucleoside 2-deoxyribosyltransferase [Burkholderiaceae bacterium]|nr:nucleoside 2-deoxyribosyltransferase [Sulfuritalea sp.]MCF8175453.1 nucleoside 2-deoxyribosyltransferase [Burkholderiaceae bacterium]